MEEIKTFEYKTKRSLNSDTDLGKALALKMAQRRRDEMTNALRIHLFGQYEKH